MAPKVRTLWWLWAGDRPTEGGMALIKTLAGKRIKAGPSKYRHAVDKRVINWGCTKQPEVQGPIKVLNNPELIRKMVNKLSFFQWAEQKGFIKDQLVPPYVTTKEKAEQIFNDGRTVVCRTVLNGHSGDGIVIHDPRKVAKGKAPKECPEAKLYTVYVPKDEEYRIHLLKGRDGNLYVFYVQKKVKRPDFDGEANRKVRCWQNGYTYQHNNVEVPDVVKTNAIKVFGASGLDFGAVDVIFCRAANLAYILEINTAPGLEGTSLERYSEAFKKYL